MSATHDLIDLPEAELALLVEGLHRAETTADFERAYNRADFDAHWYPCLDTVLMAARNEASFRCYAPHQHGDGFDERRTLVTLDADGRVVDEGDNNYYSGEVS